MTMQRSGIGSMLHRFIRWGHHVYAVTNGYFWLPCDLCGKWHGGHEMKLNGYVGLTTDRPGIRKGVCDDCAREIMARHPAGAVIDVDPVTLRETVTAWTCPPNSIIYVKNEKEAK